MRTLNDYLANVLAIYISDIECGAFPRFFRFPHTYAVRTRTCHDYNLRAVRHDRVTKYRAKNEDGRRKPKCYAAAGT